MIDGCLIIGTLLFIGIISIPIADNLIARQHRKKLERKVKLIQEVEDARQKSKYFGHN